MLYLGSLVFRMRRLWPSRIVPQPSKPIRRRNPPEMESGRTGTYRISRRDKLHWNAAQQAEARHTAVGESS